MIPECKWHQTEAEAQHPDTYSCPHLEMTAPHPSMHDPMGVTATGQYYHASLEAPTSEFQTKFQTGTMRYAISVIAQPKTGANAIFEQAYKINSSTVHAPTTHPSPNNNTPPLGE